MDDDIAIALTRAIREHSGLTLAEIRDAGEHGADAGWSGFTYTADGADFTEKNAALLDELLQVSAHDYGYDGVAAFIASFRRFDMAETLEGYKCLIAWYALETVGRFWNERA